MSIDGSDALYMGDGEPFCICDFPDECDGNGALECSGCVDGTCLCTCAECAGEADCDGCENCDPLTLERIVTP